MSFLSNYCDEKGENPSLWWPVKVRAGFMWPLKRSSKRTSHYDKIGWNVFSPVFLLVYFHPHVTQSTIVFFQTNDYSFGSLLQKPTHSLMNPLQLPLFIFYISAASLWRKKKDRTLCENMTDIFYVSRLFHITSRGERARTAHNMCFNLSFFLCTNKAC